MHRINRAGQRSATTLLRNRIPILEGTGTQRAGHGCGGGDTLAKGGVEPQAFWGRYLETG